MIIILLVKAKKRNGIVHAYDLVISLYCSKEECNRFIEKLNGFGLKFTLKCNRGLYSIRCGTKSARKFIELIKPYCPNLECFRKTKFKRKASIILFSELPRTPPSSRTLFFIKRDRPFLHLHYSVFHETVPVILLRILFFF